MKLPAATQNHRGKFGVPFRSQATPVSLCEVSRANSCRSPENRRALCRHARVIFKEAQGSCSFALASIRLNPAQVRAVAWRQFKLRPSWLLYYIILYYIILYYMMMVCILGASLSFVPVWKTTKCEKQGKAHTFAC